VAAALVVGVAVGLFAGVGVASAILPTPSVTATDTKLGHQVSVSWTLVPFATSYVVQYATDTAGPASNFTTAAIVNAPVSSSIVTSRTGLLDDGSTYTFQVRALEASPTDSGLYGPAPDVTVSDGTSPTVSFVTSPTVPASGWYSVIPTWTLNATDGPAPAGSDIASISAADYNAGAHGALGSPLWAWQLITTQGTPSLQATAQIVQFQTQDNAGNVSVIATRAVNVDTAVPTVTFGALPASSTPAGWFTSGVPTVTLTPSDGAGMSGIATVVYRLGNAATSTVTTSQPVVISPAAIPQGTTVLSYYTTNNAGTASAVTTVALMVDTQAPPAPGAPTLTSIGSGQIKVTWPAVTDPTPGSGVSTYTVYYNSTSTAVQSVTATSGQASVTLPGTSQAALVNGVTYYVGVSAADTAGNTSALSGQASLTLDTTPPVVTFYGFTGSAYSTASSLPGTITASDSVLTSLKYVFYKNNASVLPTVGFTTVYSGAATSTVATGTFTSPLGQWDLEVVAADAAGNVATYTSNTGPTPSGNPTASADFWTDNAAPVTSYVTSPAAPDGGNGTWVGGSSNDTVTLNVSDAATPSVTTYYAWWNGVSNSGTVTVAPGNLPATTNIPSVTGTYTLQYYSVNGAGTAEAPVKTATFVVNTSQPALAGQLVPSVPTTQSGWYSVAPSLMITATPAWASTGTISYAYDSIPATSGGWTTLSSATGTAAVPASLEGSHTIYYQGTDNNGITGGVYSTSYKLDTIKPTIGAIVPTATVSLTPTLTVQLTDTESGINASNTLTYIYQTAVVGGLQGTSNVSTSGLVTYKPLVPLVLGQNYFEVVAQDKAGNQSTSFQYVTLLAPGTTYTLTYLVSPVSGGSIVGSATQSVAAGSPGSSVTATAAAGYSFTGWSDGVTAATRTDTPTGNMTVTANFAPTNPSYSISFNSNGGSAVGTITQSAGTSVTAPSAPTRTGYTFAGWYSDSLLTLPYTFTTMPASNTTLYAKWTVNSYTLTYTAGAGGTITGTSPQTVAYSGSGTLVTAAPATGYHFVSWSDGVTTAARTDSNVSANISVTANFAANPPATFTLTYTAGSNGTISGTSLQTVNSGSNGTAVTAVANTGYHFVSWSDGVTTATRTDLNVTANISVTANFAVTPPVTFTLIYTAGSNGTISGTSLQTVNSGSNGTAVTAVANTGYHFVNWSDGSTSNPRTDTNVTANVSVTANFALTTNIPTSLTIATTATSVTRGKQFILSGLMTPTPGTVGVNVIVWVKKPGRAYYSYSSNRTVYADAHTGLASWQYKYNTLKTQAKGTYRFYVSFVANGVYLPSTSLTKTISFK
jgi:uncharacterized repeat protein (TIGR02543 family)